MLRRTRMKKVSDKKKKESLGFKKVLEGRKLRAWKLHELYMRVWKAEPHYCMSCDKWLGDEPRITFFDHLLEKSKYPELEFDDNNIFLCCWDCHSLKTNGHPTEEHEEAIINYKKLIGL